MTKEEEQEFHEKEISKSAGGQAREMDRTRVRVRVSFYHIQRWALVLPIRSRIYT